MTYVKGLYFTAGSSGKFCKATQLPNAADMAGYSLLDMAQLLQLNAVRPFLRALDQGVARSALAM